MAYQLAFTDVAMTATFTFTDQGCLLGDPAVAAVITNLHMVKSALDLGWLRFEPDGTGLYDYKFRHKDGRRWNQKISFAVPSDPKMSFNSQGDLWAELSEFQHHRQLRSSVIALHNWRPLDSLMVTFV